MRKFIVRTILFLAIMFVADRLVGIGMDYLASHPKGGMTLRRNYIIDHCKEDVLVLGSSRAHYHYNPRIIADSLGLSCFNCGENAMGIVLFYTWWKVISQRYHPQLVVYEVTPEFDIRKSNNNDYLWRLRRYYDRNGVSAVFDKVDPKERWKMYCRMYRYNSTFMELAADMVHPLKLGGDNGYEGINKIISKRYANAKPRFQGANIVVDSLKLDYFEKMIQEMGTTKLMLVASPYYVGADEAVFEPIRKMSQQYGIPFLDYSNNPKYLRKEQYFFDCNHLNATGADAFTSDLVGEIRKVLGGSPNVSDQH